VRAIRVAPGDEVGKLALKVHLGLRDQLPARALILPRSDEALDHGNTALLLEGAIPWADVFAVTPALDRPLRGPISRSAELEDRHALG
jgi:hypothetical protein